MNRTILPTLVAPALVAPALVATALLSGCTTPQAAAPAPFASAALQQANGQPAGTARIVRQGDGLTLNISAVGIAPGAHGIHLHMTGDCSAPGFTSAGGHLNPDKHQHGLDNPAGSHLGDLPNIVVADSGNGTLAIRLAGLAAELEPVLFDADGTAVVIHAAPDDNRTDPSGNSGARIACGVLVRG